MTYTQLAVMSVVAVVIADLWVFGTKLLTRRIFWVSYAIVVFFQLLSNGVLTGFRIVRYDGEVIIGSTTPEDGPPPLLGDGRIAYAPVEDLMFGFALITLTLVLWVWWGRRGLQRTPYSGPPIPGFPGVRQPPGCSSSGAKGDESGTEPSAGDTSTSPGGQRHGQAPRNPD